MSKGRQNQPIKDILVTPSPCFTTHQINEFAQKTYGLEGKLSPLDSERDQNFHIKTKPGDQYVIKIANSDEDPGISDLQIKALEYIANSVPELPVPRVLLSKNERAIEQIQTNNGTKHPVRVLSFLEGAYPEQHPTNIKLHHPIGTCLGRLTHALKGFSHPKANYELLWDLKNSNKLRKYLSYIPDENHQELIKYFLDRFEENVLPKIPDLRAQIVHNDLTPDNILVATDDPGQIVGIIDFGDMLQTALIIDLASTVESMLADHIDPIDAAVKVITGYHQIIPLERGELRVLFDLVAARLTMMNVIALWRVTLHPDNEEYIMGGVEATWSTLKKWRALDPEIATQEFLRACNL